MVIASTISRRVPPDLPEVLQFIGARTTAARFRRKVPSRTYRNRLLHELVYRGRPERQATRERQPVADKKS